MGRGEAPGGSALNCPECGADIEGDSDQFTVDGIEDYTELDQDEAIEED